MITEHKKLIKKMFRDNGVHVTVNHSVHDDCEPNVGFHVIIRRRRTKDSKVQRPMTRKEASRLLFNYAYSIAFK